MFTILLRDTETKLSPYVFVSVV